MTDDLDVLTDALRHYGYTGDGDRVTLEVVRYRGAPWLRVTAGKKRHELSEAFVRCVLGASMPAPPANVAFAPEEATS